MGELIEHINAANLYDGPLLELKALVTDDTGLSDEHFGVWRDGLGFLRGGRCRCFLDGRCRGGLRCNQLCHALLRGQRPECLVPDALRFFQAIGVSEVLQHPNAEVTRTEGLLCREVVHVSHLLTNDPQFVPDRADRPVLVIERIVEVTQSLGEHAELGLEIVRPVLVTAREALLLVENLQHHGPRVTAQIGRELHGNDRIESLSEVVEALLDGEVRLESHQKRPPSLVPGSMPSSKVNSS